MTPHAPVVDALIKCITTLRALRRDSPRTFFLSLLVASGGLLFGLTVVYGTEERSMMFASHHHRRETEDREEFLAADEEDTTGETSKTTLTPRATPETAWEKLANLALFCACVATINDNGRQTGAEDAIFSGRAANRRATGDESRGWFEQQQRAKELEWKPMGRTSGVGVIESV